MKWLWITLASIATLAIVVTSVVVISNVGDSSSAETTTTPQLGPGAAPGGLDSGAIEELRDCMEEQGVELPDPSTGGPPSGDLSRSDRRKLRNALEACQEYLPQGAPGGGFAPGGGLGSSQAF